MPNHSLDEVTAAVRAVAAEYPDRVDTRAARGLEPRYLEHGKPCCLVAEVVAEAFQEDAWGRQRRQDPRHRRPWVIEAVGVENGHIEQSGKST